MDHSKRSRACFKCRFALKFTAGGEFHPALKTYNLPKKSANKL